jgi:hypothetical protein
MRSGVPSALLARPIRATVALLGASAVIVALFSPAAEAASLPQGFSDETVWGRSDQPGEH